MNFNRGIMALALSGVFSVVFARQPLPVPCSGTGACGSTPNPSANLPFSPTSGTANPVTMSNPLGGQTLTVVQTVQRQIFNWASFDIAKNNGVVFQQPNAGASALNRIYDANASLINGSISANGQVMLINTSGIIFDANAQVNVGSLVASSLNISDANFLNPVFFASLQRSSVLNPVFLGGGSGYIHVDTGAKLSTTNGGSIWLLAPNVSNSGVIQTTEGQVILAAGQKVYLQQSGDPSLRGFLVEVDGGGKASNLGDIIATRGNATLVGIAVNQAGRISATTSATLNGSIRLLARDNATSPGETLTASNTAANGMLDENGQPITPGIVLGANSVTSVTPELGSAQVASPTTFQSSTIDVYGHTIQVLDNALVRATAGTINFTAAQNPHAEQFSSASATRAADIHAYFAPGSVVDVSGTQNVALSLESNSISANLQSAQLADAPVQHNGFLLGKTVTVDLRAVGNGKLPVADISGYVSAANQQTVDQLTTKGGMVNIKSEGDIVLRAGSRIDVSGGSVNYAAGTITSTQLFSNGKSYDIARAPANLIYSGFFNRSHHESGYVEGSAAGKISLQGFAYALDGTLLGNTTVGARQQASGVLPAGGTLQIGSDSGRAFTPSVDFATGATLLPDTYAYRQPLPYNNLTLATDALRSGGFSNLLVYSGGRIHLPSGVNLTLAHGGGLTLTGLQVAVDGAVTIHDGQVDLSAKEVTEGQVGMTDLSLGAGAQIDVSGLWVNDRLTPGSPTGPLAINGGTVKLSSQLGLELNAGSVVDVSGGGWLNAAGKLKAGDAGGITLLANQALRPEAVSGELQLDGSLLGTALGQGGALTIETPNVRIGSGLAGAPGVFTLDAGFFTQGGFENFNIDGQQRIEVLPGTLIAPVAQNRVLDSNYVTQATGSRLADFSRQLAQPIAFLRRPVSLTLTALGGEGVLPRQGALTIGQDAVLRTDPGSSIKLSAAQSLDVNGTLEAPGGGITLDQSNKGLSPASNQFNNQNGIWLGSHARLLAPGYAKILTDRLGARTGSVLPGGAVDIAAALGYVMTDAAALIDVSGASGQVNQLPGTNIYVAPTSIGGDAGSLAISASEGVVLNAQLRGGVALAGAQPGRFSLSVDTRNSASDRAMGGYPLGERTLLITENASDLPSAIGAGSPVPDSYNGKAYVAAGQLRGSGFGAVTLSAEDKIQFAGSLDLAGFAQSLTLDSPVLEANGAFNVNLAAPYLTLGNTRYWRQATGSPAAGGAQLDANGSANIDLIGSLNLRGFAASTFATQGDIRLIGVAASATDTARNGKLASVGDLTFIARQIYPTTLSAYTLGIQDKPLGTITIQRASAANGSPIADTPVLSAGGALTIQAPKIRQEGVLKAPLGVIVLDAGDYKSGPSGSTRVADGDLNLGANSITSVSLENQIVPFGFVENGKLWQYALNAKLNLNIALPPEKRIELIGANQNVAPGAVVNLNGGGDLHAAEFLPGPGGSSDVLANPSVFAVLPALGNNIAPFDFQNSYGTTLQAGDSVYLAGGAGLAAGTYTLLPAQYALLPGAFAVQLAPAGTSVVPNQTILQNGGSALSAGYRLVAGTSIQQSGWSAYLVLPQAVVRNTSQYQDYGANRFFGQSAAGSSAPPLPQDAGQLVLSATQTLNIAPNTISLAASGTGLGGTLDVVAPKIAVVDNAGHFSGYLELRADTLSNIGASSVLLGGIRTQTAAGASIQVGASDVVVANGAASPLSVPDLILAARDHVTIADGSVIAASGTVGSNQLLLTLDGTGALFRATAGTQATVNHATTGAGLGLLTVGANSRLSGKSLIFDATGNTSIDATATLAAQAVSLAASEISLGDATGGAGGLNLTTNLLNQVASAADLTLHSYSTLDIYHNAHFDLTQRVDDSGNPLQSSLTLDTGAIVSHLAAGQSEALIAHRINLSNSGGAVSATGSNAGGLILSAKLLDVPTSVAAQNGSGTIALQGNKTNSGAQQGGAQLIAGFNTVDLNAGSQIMVGGTGSLTLNPGASGVLNLRAPRLTAANKAQYTIDAGTGALNILPLAAGFTPLDGSSLGAQLTLRGAALAQLGAIVLHGGNLTLDATQGDVVLGSDAPGAAASLTDVSGWAEAFADQTSYYPGGTLALQAEQGNVLVNTSATLDVSAARGRQGQAVGDAGRLQIAAPTRTALIHGALLGAGGADRRGGNFRLDVASLNDAETLARKLFDGGFNDAIQWRARTGDIRLAQYLAGADGTQSAVKLQAANINLEADAGSLHVAAQLDASGAKGGRITLSAQQDIEVESSATLDVSASGAGNAGGSIDLASTSGFITLNASTLNAGGAAGNGKVRLRALRNAANNDVQIDVLSAVHFNNVNSVQLEAYKTYASSGTIKATDFATTGSWYSDAKNFMGNTATIKKRLGVASDNRIRLAPGIEVQSSLSSGDLTLSAASGDVSLATWRYDPVNGNVAPTNQLASGLNMAGQNLVAGVLTLRAGGNLNLNGSLSDGFSAAATSGVLQGLDSWSYNLIAGADTTRSDLGAVKAGIGNVTLAANKLVRTGTGYINIAAGQDVVLQSASSVIYTAGHDTPRLPDYPRLSSVFRLATFPTGGGDIAIQAGRDIVAAPESQLFTPWLFRSGSVSAYNADGSVNTAARTAWWVNFPDFQQGVGALGGGNVTVSAGRDIDNLGVVVPTNARLIPNDPANPVPYLVQQGGGDIHVTAGRDVNSGLFYVADGTGTVSAGGNLGAARQGNGQNVYTILGLGEGSFNVTANGDLNLETVVNPTLLPQGSSNTSPSVFSTYGADSAVNLVSLNGNVEFADHDTARISNAFSSIPNASPGSLFQFYPGSLSATALQGDIKVLGPIILMPTATGNLDFFAAGSILIQRTVVLSGANPDLLPTPLRPASNIGATEFSGIASPAFTPPIDLPGTPVQQNNDATRAYLVARDGDIVGTGGDYSAILAKPATVQAGNDIKNLWLSVENHDATTVSVVRAGRDIIYPDTLSLITGQVQTSNAGLFVSGPGSLEVLAGRNIELGGTNGIVSRGNLDVSNLPVNGSDLYVLAGLGQGADGQVRLPDYQAFATAYLNNGVRGRQALQDFFANVERQLHLNQALSDADVQQQLAAYHSQFNAMPLAEQAMLVFFSELKQGGLQGSAGNYQRGFEAISSLFTAGGYQGNIDLFNSQIKTESGGDINLLAPGGIVNVGLAKPGNTKAPSDQGIFTDRGGVIRSFSNGDFLVNQSRVFTLQGDDLLLWSSAGNIDAGKGSKTAAATPPPLLVFNSSGQLVLDTTSIVSGSGIGQLLARSGYTAGIVELIAPKGDVNAGEAGIKVAGDLLISAQRVLGADNIQVGGISVGVPAAQSAPLTGLTGSNGLEQGNGTDPTQSLRSQDGREQLQRIKDALSGLKTSFISVDVVGFGETGAGNADACRHADGSLDAACASAKKNGT